MTDRQTQAVAEAIERTIDVAQMVLTDPITARKIRAKSIAHAAIEASDAKYIPMLVEALKYYQHLEPEGFKAKLALEALPEDLR